MSQINGIGNVTYSALPLAAENDFSSQGATQTFSAAYKLALANAALPQETAPTVNSLSSVNEAGHIPLTGLQQKEGGEEVHEIALGLRAYRQQLLASNIANADTPGYKAVDIDFQEALRISRTIVLGLAGKLLATSAGHLSHQATIRYSSIPLKYHVPQQASIDGNTVEMDVEMAKFTGNALMYQFAMDRAGGHYKEMLGLLKGLT
ncbi:flagellar basal body rod protein FlgB [Sulfurirhabdus autotrophica]|uniref:Flagellar basal body rod protein FlgB n=1 Tax=Sulfurirhabdus autotrophica TaxID=1706046 RepID=A0A4R3XTS8_9PROT|nr:flagellar basal body rod protein FlgB [Sulfurirhabdus autotrophica]TCV78221.1 flagellar basal-body rod protein FlgB [Sulfurirhabdus autotrophica]